MNESESWYVGNALMTIENNGYVSLKSRDGFVLCSIHPGRNEVYFCPKGKYTSDQVLVSKDPYAETHKVIDNPDKPTFTYIGDNRFIRLAKVEKQLKDLLDEVKCIRNND